MRRSPAARSTGGSDLRGLKWHTQWLRDTQVGKAMPAERKKEEEDREEGRKEREGEE